MRRRAFLRRAGTVAVAGAAASSTASADGHLEHWAAQPDDVTVTFDESWLADYQPRVVTSHLDVAPVNMHAWRARHDSRDTSIGCYWTFYQYQEGVTGLDSHEWDHEPIYIVVDDSSGDIVEVLYTGYHWLRASTGVFPQSGSHPLFRAVENYHHYIPADKVGEALDLRDLTESFSTWLTDHGMAEALHPGAVTDPWQMQRRESWWRDGTLAGIRGKMEADLGVRLGVRGASQSPFDVGLF